MRLLHVQSFCQDHMGRKINGVASLLIDDNKASRLLYEAYINKSKRAKSGPLVATFHPAPLEQANYVAAQTKLDLEKEERDRVCMQCADLLDTDGERPFAGATLADLQEIRSILLRIRAQGAAAR